MGTVCPDSDPGACLSMSGQLTATLAQTLGHFHLSLSDYGAYFTILNVLVSLLSWGIGLVLFWRKSDEWMGLFVSLLFVLFAGMGVSNSLQALWLPAGSRPLFSVLLNVISAAEWMGLGCFLLTFPMGRIAPRWSWVIFSFWVLTFAESWFQDFLPSAEEAFGLVSLVETLLVFGGTLFILVYRYMRVFDATQRQQTKWVVYGAVAWVALDIVGTTLTGVIAADSPFQVLLPTVVIMLPAAVLFLALGFAMLRYRLWDIDAIINRTLVYGTLTAILTA